MQTLKTHNPKIKYKIVLLGDQGVGKTAIINRFINDNFHAAYDVPNLPTRQPSASTSSSRTQPTTRSSTVFSCGIRLVSRDLKV